MSDLQAILKKHPQLIPKLSVVSTPATELQKSLLGTSQPRSQVSSLAAAEEVTVSDDNELGNQKVHQ